jgi:competence protein ComEA
VNSVLELRRSRNPIFGGYSKAMKFVATLLIAGCTFGADLPSGAGKALVLQLCSKCHSPEQATSLHQDQRHWESTISKMIALGAQGSDDQFETIINYLTANFGPLTPRQINVNDATAVEMETGLDLKRSESLAIVQYRTDHGPFKTIDDFKNVPGLDFSKIEAVKARIAF